MNWKCLFFHDYKIKNSCVSKYYDYQSSPLPLRVETTFLYICSRCEDVKIKTVDGRWHAEIHNDDDDDGGKGDDPPAPQLSPDDFYESICKE